MKCPNCNKEMKKSSTFELREDEGEVDEFCGLGLHHNYAYMKVFIYKCNDCKIKYKEDEFESIFYQPPQWKLPKDLMPSEKQIKYAKNLGYHFDISTDDLVTKKDYWNFINKYADQYKKDINDYKKYKSEYEEDYEVLEFYDESMFY